MASKDTTKGDEDNTKRNDDNARRDKLREQAGIGRGLGEDLVSQASEELELVPIQESYRRRAHKDIPFEPLEGRDITKVLVDSWVEDPRNIRRVGEKLGIKLREEGGPDLLDGWAAVRIKQLSTPGRLRGFSNKTQIVVLIALNKWDRENGFFLSDIEMEKGEDIILNGGDDVVFPGSGGGLVIIFYLQP